MSKLTFPKYDRNFTKAEYQIMSYDSKFKISVNDSDRIIAQVHLEMQSCNPERSKEELQHELDYRKLKRNFALQHIRPHHQEALEKACDDFVNFEYKEAHQ